MKLIAGLGNPGAEYANTKHNVGFMLIDALAEHLNASAWKEDFSSFDVDYSGSLQNLSHPL